ncbi:MAG: SOS response-associated peptidase [Renibacterium salmoninarum]|nr:SOS response-associated peptidase [Renibacterium salmoninarum]
MCGRYAIDAEVNDMIIEFVLATGQSPHDWRPGWQAEQVFRPTDPVPILIETLVDRKDPEGRTQRRAEAAQWWLTPSFAKELRGKHPTFNARSETVTELASYRGPVKRQRAVLPARGYFETQTEGKTKTSHFVQAPEGPLFFAGLYSWWADPRKPETDPERWHLTTTILTRPAIGDVAQIHPRTPLCLPADWIEEWIDPKQLGTAEFVASALAASDPVVRGLRFGPAPANRA